MWVKGRDKDEHWIWKKAMTNGDGHNCDGMSRGPMRNRSLRVKKSIIITRGTPKVVWRPNLNLIDRLANPAGF